MLILKVAQSLFYFLHAVTVHPASKVYPKLSIDGS
jgi:hypothetical protein